MKKTKVLFLKPVAGYGYHTGMEGIIEEDRVEALEKGGFIRTIPNAPISTKEAKEQISKAKK